MAEPVKLRCECCGFEQEFDSAEDAYQLGWDEPTHMGSWLVTCDLCPGMAPGHKPVDHSAEHARWEGEGRPAEFRVTDEMRAQGYGVVPDEAALSLLKELVRETGGDEAAERITKMFEVPDGR